MANPKPLWIKTARPDEYKCSKDPSVRLWISVVGPQGSKTQWHLYPGVGLSADLFDESPKETSHAIANETLLATLPTVIVSKIPSYVLSGINPYILRMLVCGFSHLLGELSAPPSFPRLETYKGEECPICMERLDSGVDIERLRLDSRYIEQEPPWIAATSCGHLFHPRCLNRDLSSNDNHRCPMCRTVYDSLFLLIWDALLGVVEQDFYRFPLGILHFGEILRVEVRLYYGLAKQFDGTFQRQLRAIGVLHRIDRVSAERYRECPVDIVPISRLLSIFINDDDDTKAVVIDDNDNNHNDNDGDNHTHTHNYDYDNHENDDDEDNNDDDAISTMGI